MPTAPATAAAAIWTVLILLATLLPLPALPVPEDGTGWFNIPSDKIAHASLFAIFAVLWGLAEGHQKLWPIGVATAGVALGGLTEAVQAIPALHRVADWEDLVADGVGVAAGIGAVFLFRWIFTRFREHIGARTPALLPREPA